MAFLSVSVNHFLDENSYYICDACCLCRRSLPACLPASNLTGFQKYISNKKTFFGISFVFKCVACVQSTRGSAASAT